MKRVAPSTDDARRRKSARIATQALKCPLPKEEKYTYVAWKDTADHLLKLDNVARNSELYNAWLPYAQNHPEAVEGSLVVNNGEAFLRNVREVDQILAEAKQRLLAKYEEMRIQVMDFASSVRFKLDGWYEGGDIFGSSFSVRGVAAITHVCLARFTGRDVCKHNERHHGAVQRRQAFRSVLGARPSSCRGKAASSG